MTFAYFPAVIVLAGVFCFMAYYFSILRPRKGTLDWVALQDDRVFTFALPRHPMERKDALPVLLITVAYAFTAFFQLGSLKGPDYRQACDFSDAYAYTLQVEGEAFPTQTLWYYPMLGTGSYHLEISSNGRTWSALGSTTEIDDSGKEYTHYYWTNARGRAPDHALKQTYNHVFKWTELQWDDPISIQYIRVTGRADKDVLQLGKLLFLDESGQPISFQCTPVLPYEEWSDYDTTYYDRLVGVFTPDDTVPGAISWRNSAYFDEIYHPRTALEHMEGQYPFENSHPPLGKLIIALGIQLFGMTPFGWRFMGALFGVLMVPLFYLFLKNIFGRRNIAVCGTILLATEFMHLTQTRIATIDTYGVFFILLSYLFFYRWLTAPATPKKSGKVSQGYGQLALSGVFWGVGCACKWTVIYAGVGLAVLYLIHIILRVKTWPRDELRVKRGLGKWLWATLGVSVVAFVVIPAVVYTLSYIPYALAAGKPTLAGVIDEMWRNQGDMLSYHSQVHSFHPYASRWYQWLVDARPILYYYKDIGGGMVEKFSALTNPLTTWLGLLAMMTCLGRCLRRTWARLTLMWGAGLGCCLVCWLVGRVENGDFDPTLSPQELWTRFWVMGACLALYLAASTLIALVSDRRPSALSVFITVGFAAQFLPWVVIGRITFAYHYFPSTLFLILAICLLFQDLMDSPRAKWRWPVYGVTAASAALYLLFYPYLTGLAMPVRYFNSVLRFLPSWV